MRKLCALLLLVCASLAYAADPNSSSAIIAVENAKPAAPPALRGPNEFGVWGGFTANEPTVLAISHDRRVSLLGLRYSRRIFQTRAVAFSYAADFLPMVLVSQPRDYKGLDMHDRELIYGTGLAPVGLHFDFATRHRWQPFLEAGGGGVLFTRPAPASDATKFNFMLDFGAGVEFFQRSGHALVFGYRLHHISNAFRVAQNPGIDSNMFYTGFSFFK